MFDYLIKGVILIITEITVTRPTIAQHLKDNGIEPSRVTRSVFRSKFLVWHYPATVNTAKLIQEYCILHQIPVERDVTLVLEEGELK